MRRRWMCNRIPRVGDYRLSQLTVEVISDLRAAMTADGVGDTAVRKALTVLQSTVQRAVEWAGESTKPVG